MALNFDLKMPSYVKMLPTHPSGQKSSFEGILDTDENCV
jgi:hypothetical protein